MNKNKNIIIISIAIFVILLGGTYAWYEFNTSAEEQTTIHTTVEGLNITYNGGSDISGANLTPVSNKTSGITKDITLSLAEPQGNNVCARFYLTTTTLPVGLQDRSFKYEIVSGSTKVGSGNFSNKVQGTTYQISNYFEVTTTPSIYTLYIWIDGNLDNPTAMQNQNFSFTINAEAGNCPANLDNSGANAPVLAEGMIPVMWDGAKWVKADDSTHISTSSYPWYDYDNKLWANAVMVSTDGGGVTGSKTRQQYMDVAPGTPVLEDDILAYYVWIPRYRYTLFNVGTDTVPEQLINVTFETANTVKSDGKCNGSHETETNDCDLTHPAFTWGTGDELQELDGIWVGKFETTGTTASPTVKPSLSPLVEQTVSGLYSANKVMNSATYLTTTGVSEIDVHMMKNTEWGAVAYLKQSAYGLGTTDIALNNYRTGSSYSEYAYQTGCGSAVGTTTTTPTCEAYTSTNGQNASTTGNITGVYDMSGGTLELVMGVESNSSGTTINYRYGGSHFRPTLSCKANTYVNCYLAPSSPSDFSKRILGDATAETRAWYSDRAYFVYSISTGSFPWFIRGGYASGGANAGAFNFTYSDGYLSRDSGSRASAFVIPS